MRDVFAAEPRVERVLDARHRFAPVAEHRADTRRDHAMTIGIKRAEAEVLQFGLEAVHAQPLRDRRVDVERFARDAAARFGIDRAERAHVVQAVGELDQDHAQIARHRQQHLAEAFGGGFLPAAEAHLVELGDAVDELGDGGAELGRDLLGSELGVFERVVQDRRDDRLGVHAELGEDAGDGDRVRDVGLAALARLPFVGERADFVSAAHARDLLGREIGGEALFEPAHVGGRRICLNSPGGQGRAHGRLTAAAGQAAPREAAGRAGGADASQVVAALGQVVVDFGGGPFECFAFFLLLFLLVDLVDHRLVDLAIGDFAQRDHGRLVVVADDGRLRALRDLTRALGRHQDELEAVVHHFEAIFYGNACHFYEFSSQKQASIHDVR